MFATLAGLLLGKKYGTMSVALYIAIGLAGVPVFAFGGGLWYVFQPTFGYILGYLPAVYITGYMMEKSRTASSAAVLRASFVNVLVVYMFGLPYFYMILNFYLGQAFSFHNLMLLALLPTIPGKIITCFACVELHRRLAPVISTMGINQRRLSNENVKT
jgi:biotin transport system substrate-specific component